MSNIKIGQIWENKHLFNDAYDVVVCWVTDGFVWMRYTNDDALFKESQSFFLRLRRLKSDSYFLNDNQKIVFEWLKEAYKRTKWSSPFGTVYSTINTHELFVRTRLTKAQQYKVLAAFAEWGLSHAEE